MEAKEIELEGKKYQAYVASDEPPGAYIIIGPPEGLTEYLELPEPFATTLHNILYSRGLYNYKAITANQKVAIGALQEALAIDVQKLVQAYFHLENE